jgi:hydrogenase nickel incorporation protein HypA/HybF
MSNKPLRHEVFPPVHEISIAENILQIAEAKAREQNARSIQLIKLRLGTFTTIVEEALQFAFEVCRQGTLAAEAILEIETVEMVTECMVCDSQAQPAHGICLICRTCGFPLRILAGEELRVEYIEVDLKQEESLSLPFQNVLPSRPMY